MANWLKTKYYPVDVHRKIIYDDPQPRERDCSFGTKYNLEKTGTIGIKGAHMLAKATIYDTKYETRPPVS